LIDLILSCLVGVVSFFFGVVNEWCCKTEEKETRNRNKNSEQRQHVQSRVVVVVVW